MTKRKAFSFLRSYYDVLDEIYDDKDKLKFLMAILDRQFEGTEPELEGIVKLSYVSQRHSIDASRIGWEKKVGYEPPTEGDIPTPTHRVGGSQGGSVGGIVGGIGHPTEGNTLPPSNNSVMTTEGGIEPHTIPPSPQEQEKEQEKEQEEVKEHITSYILGDLEKKKFYVDNKPEIEFLRTNYGYDVDTAIEVHFNNVKTLETIGWVNN